MGQLACLGLAVVGLESETVGRVAVRRGATQAWRATRRLARFRRCGCRHAVRPLVGKFREFVMTICPVQEMRQQSKLGLHVCMHAVLRAELGVGKQGGEGLDYS